MSPPSSKRALGSSCGPLPALGPLRFERRFFAKPWGGRGLARRPGIALPAELERVGETWELVDREGECSVVAVGPWRGRTLQELMAERGEEILGDAPAGRGGRFPLLVKYLDAREELSVQVHPDDEAAARIGGGAEGKTEAWYVVDVAPGGGLWAGLREGTREADYRRVAGSRAGLAALVRHAVAAGDCLLVPGGTVHAIGAGVTILEVQQSSDTTYRLWDWDRVGLDGKPRDVHLEEALRSVRFGGAPPRAQRPVFEDVLGSPALRRARLARSEHFGMDALRVAGRAELSTGDAYRIVAVLAGRGTLSVPDAAEHTLAPGDVWLVPAVSGTYELSGELELVLLFHHD